MTQLVDDGSIGACEHLLEVAEKQRREAIEARNTARAMIVKCDDEIRRRRAQLKAAQERV
jgi:hypothetical protein